MALMASEGLITPMPEAAVFAGHAGRARLRLPLALDAKGKAGD